MKTAITPGTKIKLFYKENNINNRLLHILTIVDGDQVVVKSYSKYTQCWKYEVKDMYWFNINQKHLSVK
jgi:hypothetical protein